MRLTGESQFFQQVIGPWIHTATLAILFAAALIVARRTRRWPAALLAVAAGVSVVASSV